MSSFKLTILGSSSALPTVKRSPTAQVLNVHERFFLIDCGEGTQLQLRKYKIKLGRLNHIFISHAHGDHVFGLFGLISTLNLLGQKSDIHIFAPEILRETINHFINYFAKDLKFQIIFKAYSAKKSELIYENKSLTVHTIPLKHRVPTCGFLFQEKEWKRNIIKEKIKAYEISIRNIQQIKDGADLICSNGDVIPNNELTLPSYKARSYAYCSDTAYTKNIVPIIKNVDLLYHESTFLEEDAGLAKKTGHSTAKQAADIAMNAEVGKLVLGHFSARYKKDELFLSQAKELFTKTFMANDGDEFNLPLVRHKD